MRAGQPFVEMGETELTMFVKESFWLPRSEAGRRIVTTHGDFHPENIVRDGAGGALRAGVLGLQSCAVG